MRRFILFLLFICFSIACKHEKVEELEKQENYELELAHKLKEIINQAEKGNAEAQFNIGYLHLEGEGIGQSY